MSATAGVGSASAGRQPHRSNITSTWPGRAAVPLPLFGAVPAIFSQQSHGPAGATGVLDGFLLGLLAPAAFFFALALTLPAIGAIAFIAATASALGTQALSMLGFRRTP